MNPPRKQFTIDIEGVDRFFLKAINRPMTAKRRLRKAGIKVTATDRLGYFMLPQRTQFIGGKTTIAIQAIQVIIP